MTPTHATGAVLFVDISGSTQLYETLGDEQALARVGRSLALIARVCEDCGGKVIRTTGDGALCMFETADAALRASRLMQEKTDEQQEPGEPGSDPYRLPLRAGARRAAATCTATR